MTFGKDETFWSLSFYLRYRYDIIYLFLNQLIMSLLLSFPFILCVRRLSTTNISVYYLTMTMTAYRRRRRGPSPVASLLVVGLWTILLLLLIPKEGIVGGVTAFSGGGGGYAQHDRRMHNHNGLDSYSYITAQQRRRRRTSVQSLTTLLPRQLLTALYSSKGSTSASNSSNSSNNEAVKNGSTGTTTAVTSSTSPSPSDADVMTMTATTTLTEVDVLYESRTSLVYDPVQERYLKQRSRNKAASRHNKNDDDDDDDDSNNNSSSNKRRRRDWPGSSFFRQTIIPRLSVAFLPSGVTPNYYKFMRWRVLQRFVNANLHVFGTQSLLLGLNIKSSSSQLGALSAALKWVLKDALGKIVRMLWASQMGRRFDSDAKRWRYRSAFCFAAGNGLEIVTFIFPQLFLLFATAANCCKQVSMLTSSSTRTAIYNSFRDGSRENIGDITAKGEAQIAIVDLLGIASGVSLSRAVGTSVRSVLAAYVGLQILEVICMYRQMRSVQYRVLNFERMVEVIGAFVESSVSSVSENGVHKNANATLSIPTPQEIAITERIFLPPRHLARRSEAFGSLGRAKLSPTELNDLLKVFERERFILVVGANVKNPHEWKRRLQRMTGLETRLHAPTTALKENCHIVLHSQATQVDIVKSTLAITLLRRKLAASNLDPAAVRSSDCMDLIEASCAEADQTFTPLLRQMSKQGWESPARFMFGRVHMRAEWPLMKRPGVGESAQ